MGCVSISDDVDSDCKVGKNGLFVNEWRAEDTSGMSIVQLTSEVNRRVEKEEIGNDKVLVVAHPGCALLATRSGCTRPVSYRLALSLTVPVARDSC
jgi:hypothetical protein